ncbi:MAG: hypothetical protein P8R54_28000 [Myxococcota bacterium]|nr:hypothetical protein [Myxococcota bacterium]
MPVYAMKVTSKSTHEKTDKLFIYTFESPEQGTRTIVANLTNVYEVGDVVAVAQLGTRLPGVVLKPRKVFGIDSEGMAMGPVEAELDTDLSAQFEADAPEGRFTVTLTVEVSAHYAEDAQALAAKAIGKGKGTLVSAERA